MNQLMKRVLREAASRFSQICKRAANPMRVAALRRGRSVKVHFGCGSDRLCDFVNVDYRPTKATDVILDLNRPRLSIGSVSFAYSHAFFEHLYRRARLPHLRCVREALEPGGICCYIGIPYFRNIAKLYLERGPGTAGPVFDLYNVYRYTHGDPEQVPRWWLGQLHKSLFDEEEVTGLLREAGFASFTTFCYGYPGDVHEVPINLGFYASTASCSAEKLRADCLSFLERFADTKIRLSTFEWLGDSDCR